MKKIKKVQEFFQKNVSLDLAVKERFISLSGSVDSDIHYVSDLIQQLNKLNNKPIILRICSPGGYVDHGLALYDVIKNSKAPIYTECYGIAASMAAVLLGAGKKGKRSISKNSRVMIHQPSGGYMGKAQDIEVHSKEITRIHNLLAKLLADDTGQAIKKVAKDILRDYWMTAEEAVLYGIVDKVI